MSKIENFVSDKTLKNNQNTSHDYQNSSMTYLYKLKQELRNRRRYSYGLCDNLKNSSKSII